MASTSPEKGSTTITQPDPACVSAIDRSSSRSATCWIASSRASTTVAPSVEGRSVWATGRRRASVCTTTLAARPRMSFSKAYSIPYMPVLSRPT